MVTENEDYVSFCGEIFTFLFGVNPQVAMDKCIECSDHMRTDSDFSVNHSK